MKIAKICFVWLFLAAACFAQVPSIVSVTPSQNELNVPKSSDISVIFDCDMDQRTINESSFIVFSASSGIKRGQISYDNVARRATLDPADNFDAGEKVTMVLTTGIRSQDGFPLAHGFIWSFITGTSVAYAEFRFLGEYNPGDGAVALTAADVDSDGDNDLISANWTSNNISVLLNNGDGTFVPFGNYDAGFNPLMVTAAEINGEDGVDLVVANAGSDNISVLFNNGDGSFVYDNAYDVDYHPADLFIGDLDGDGDNDIASTNFEGGTVSILFNAGDGMFGTEDIRYQVGGSPRGIAGGDIDNDWDLDLALVSYSSSDIEILLNDGDGSFTMGQSCPVPDPVDVYMADVNGNGSLDLAATNYQAGHVSVLQNLGNGEFGSGMSFQAGQHPWDIKAGDFDGDGAVDIASGLYDSDLAILMNDGDGNFEYPSFAIYSRSLHSADFDNDGDLDIASINGTSGKIYVSLNENATNTDPDEEILPVDAFLNQNYPNPFNAKTEISFYLPNPGRADLSIYDLAGRRVRKLANSEFESGFHRIVWDGTNDQLEPVGSGIYLYSLEFESRIISKRLVILK